MKSPTSQPWQLRSGTRRCPKELFCFRCSFRARTRDDLERRCSRAWSLMSFERWRLLARRVAARLVLAKGRTHARVAGLCLIAWSMWPVATLPCLAPSHRRSWGRVGRTTMHFGTRGSGAFPRLRIENFTQSSRPATSRNNDTSCAGLIALRRSYDKTER